MLSFLTYMSIQKSTDPLCSISVATYFHLTLVALNLYILTKPTDSSYKDEELDFAITNSLLIYFHLCSGFPDTFISYTILQLLWHI